MRTSPSKTPSARRTVARATANSSQSADSEGMRELGASSPSTMRARSTSAIWAYTPHGVGRPVTIHLLPHCALTPMRLRFVRHVARSSVILMCKVYRACSGYLAIRNLSC
jgi:hypothetical protein